MAKKKPIDSAVTHYSGIETRVIKVEEWGDENGPLEIYVTPFTLHEKGRLFAKSNMSDVNALADVLIMKAKDSKGDQVFTLDDKHKLVHKVDADVLAKVANKIISASPTNIATEKKN